MPTDRFIVEELSQRTTFEVELGEVILEYGSTLHAPNLTKCRDVFMVLETKLVAPALVACGSVWLDTDAQLEAPALTAVAGSVRLQKGSVFGVSSSLTATEGILRRSFTADSGWVEEDLNTPAPRRGVRI